MTLKKGHKFTTVVGIVIYNRYDNLEHWLDCWRKCKRHSAQVVVIHNSDKPDPKYSQLCQHHGVKYIRRRNIGYDIGAFQDVCRDRLAGFPVWDRLLWLTDDTFPMAIDFVKQFDDEMVEGIGVACMEISPYVTTHIRTTGFMIDHTTAIRLRFPADPITTKQQCYLFEHRAKSQIFYGQIKAMGLGVKMIAGRQTSPMWDTGYHRKLDRQAEHEKLFGTWRVPNRVLVICPIYKNFPLIISSMLCQVHKNWVLHLIHDGPDFNNVQAMVPDDPRIKWMATPKHGGFWGHYIRQVAIEQYAHTADFIVITNADNYHSPVFLEYLLQGFSKNEKAVAAYCTSMVHSYIAWGVIPCRLERGYLDCAAVMVRAWVAKEVGWNDITSHSADWSYFSDIIDKYGANRFQRVEGCLLVHN